jgi:peroxiredoxin
MQCRYHAGQLGQRYAEFKARDCEIILILGDTLNKAIQYAESLHLDYPVLADPDRKVYQLYGLEKALVVIQRTASLIIDLNGSIRYVKTATNPLVWLQESWLILDEIASIPNPK